MKAVQIVKPGELRIIDMEKPVIDETNNVLIRMTAAGICGSDRGIYHGTNAAATYPRVIGHEMVGVVEQVGPGVSRVKPGDRVIVDQVTACGTCYACRKGRPNVCGNLKVRGVHIDGGYRQWMAVNESDCYLLPDHISDVDAVLIEPTTIAIQCCARAEIEAEDTVLIMGAGALGSRILSVVKLHHPAKIIVADIDDAKLEAALKNGADAVIRSDREDVAQRAKELTDGYGPTLCIDAACVETLAYAFDGLEVAKRYVQTLRHEEVHASLAPCVAYLLGTHGFIRHSGVCYDAPHLSLDDVERHLGCKILRLRLAVEFLLEILFHLDDVVYLVRHYLHFGRTAHLYVAALVAGKAS